MENTQKVCIMQITISLIPLLPTSFPMGYLSLERHMHLKSNFATYLKSVSEICMNCNSHTYTYTHTHTHIIFRPIFRILPTLLYNIPVQ